jgi:hypothetical protein
MGEWATRMGVSGRWYAREEPANRFFHLRLAVRLALARHLANRLRELCLPGTEVLCNVKADLCPIMCSTLTPATLRLVGSLDCIANIFSRAIANL